MATQATFDMPLDEAITKVTGALDELHDVNYSTDTSLRHEVQIDVYLDESPMWVYPLAALIGAAPWLVAAFTSLVELKISSTEGISSTSDFGDSRVVLSVGVVAVVGCLVAAFMLVTKFKRPVHQATIKATGENESPDATVLTLTGGAERYVYLGIRRCFDEHDREEILKRTESSGSGGFSIKDLLDIGYRPDPGPSSTTAAAAGATAAAAADRVEQTDEELGR